MVKELTVSAVRHELLKLHPPSGDGAPATCELGEWFHRLYADLTGSDPALSLAPRLESADRNENAWKSALRQHAYMRYMAPMLIEQQQHLSSQSSLVADAWRAAEELCDYLAKILWDLSKHEPDKSVEELRKMVFAASEEPLRSELRQPDWTTSVVLKGQADAILRHPTTGHLCVLELKLGQQHPDVDLCQVILYRMLLARTGVHAPSAAIIRFAPKRAEEYLVEAENLTEVEGRLLDLIGRMAGVVRETVPIAGALSSNPIQVQLGHLRNSEIPALWLPNDTKNGPPHPNLALLGTMGTGKTQCVLSIVTQLRQAINNVGSTQPTVLIFDHKGDYVNESFVNAVGADCWEPFRLCVNPLSLNVRLTPGVLAREDQLLPKAVADDFVDSLGRSWNLGDNQRSDLREWCLECFRERSIHHDRPETWSKTPPTVKELCDFASRHKPKGKLKTALDDLSLSQLFHDSPESTGFLVPEAGVKVLNLKGRPESQQNVIVGCLLDLLYAEMMASNHARLEGHLRELRLIVLVDEADNFMKGEYPTLRKLLKEGREFGVGIILSTQFIEHFKTQNEDYTPYIGTWIVHKIAHINQRQAKRLGIDTDKRVKEFIAKVIGSGKHESVIVPGISGEDFTPIRDLPFYELISS